MPGKSVFISHSSKDDPLVRELRQSLEALGVEVWADSERLLGGDLLSPVLKAEVRKASYFLAVASLAALNSEWVQREIGFAKKAGKKIVPLMRPEIGPPALRLLFGEEPVGIRFDSVMHALPDILAALEMRLPTEVVRQAQEQAAPVADLVLELKDPAIADIEGKQRATAVATLYYIPADGSPKIESLRYKFTAPIGPIEAEELSWYLERYIHWPSGYFEERARRVIDALPQWGRLLYDCVNVPAAHDALHAWKSAGLSQKAAERRFTVKVDKSLIEGAPKEEQNKASEAATLLLALPWELLHDAHSYLFQGARPVRVRRSLPNRGHQAALATKPPIRVLLVSPRPDDVGYIDHRVSAKPLVEALSELGDLAEFRLLDPPTFPAVEAEILRADQAGKPYHVVHFDGHGVYDRKHGLGMLCFEDPADAGKLEHRRSKLVSADEIARIVREHRIPLFFLEACQSAQAAKDPGASVAGRLLESGVASVAAMSHSVLVESARIFIADFYRELLHGKRVGQAMLAGQRALIATTLRGHSFNGEVHLHDWFVPVLFQEEQDPVLIREIPAEQVRKVIATRRKALLGDLPEEPAHEFLGRSRDLLKTERLLARERYLVVLGSGGEGKTTFSAELARWLVETRRFARAVFTSVEQISEPRQVLFSVGGQLVSNFESRVGTDDAHGMQLVERALGEHATVVVIDNVESILDDKDAIGGILGLCAKLGKVGQTRLIFTSRGPLPKPFDADANTMRIGRLDRDSAIELLGKLLSEAPKSDESEEDLRNLVDAVGCHARSLVLIAREVGAAGVRHATRDLRPILRAIEAKSPGNRENSLLASAELSLRRLPEEIRQLIRPLSVFQGGGGIPAIAMALELDQDRLIAVVRALIAVGLAEYVEPQYLRFDPALLGMELTPEEREAATAAWAEAMAAEIEFLYGQQFKDASLANNLTLLELPNFIAALNRLAETETAERVTNLATSLESIVADLDRPRVLARIVEIRKAAAVRLSEWSQATFEAERASVHRLIDQGRHTEAVQAARVLNMKAEIVRDTPYDGADSDLAVARFNLGRALKESGDANAALSMLEAAHEHFERLGAARMAGVALTDKADCLRDLGRYDEAAAVYEQVIRIDEELLDPRGAAVDKSQLATVRMYQGNRKDALRLHSEAREAFESLNEPAAVAVIWHQIGRVHEEAGNFEGAEHAYRESLRIEVNRGNRSGQAATLNQLANLHAAVGKLEEAVRFYVQAVEIYIEAGDLRSEGRQRSNLADEFIKLRRFGEARREIERAIECKKPFGHVGEPWKTFAILYDLEIATGNQPAALAARRQAIDAYLAYRRQGGHPQIDRTEAVEMVQQDPAAARKTAEDPETYYRLAVEIILALEHPDPEPLE